MIKDLGSQAIRKFQKILINSSRHSLVSSRSYSNITLLILIKKDTKTDAKIIWFCPTLLENFTFNQTFYPDTQLQSSDCCNVVMIHNNLYFQVIHQISAIFQQSLPEKVALQNSTIYVSYLPNYSSYLLLFLKF